MIVGMRMQPQPRVERNMIALSQVGEPNHNSNHNSIHNAASSLAGLFWTVTTL
jgi:hypothetical protein